MSTYPPPAVSLDPAFVTTAFEIPGHRIVRNIGVVRGIESRCSTSIGKRCEFNWKTAVGEFMLNLTIKGRSRR